MVRFYLRVMVDIALLGCVVVASACGTTRRDSQRSAESQPRAGSLGYGSSDGESLVRISLLGTNDVHGHLEQLGRFAGFVQNLRAARQADGGAVFLFDAGDMFQGTLESNLVEGASMVRVYNALGYDAAAIGNHEFDFGPVGPKSFANPEENPFGALLSRAQEARFPMLASNIAVAESMKGFGHPLIKASVLLEKAGLKVGVIGVSTENTLKVTLQSNVKTLAMTPLAQSVIRESQVLRSRGAQVVVLLAHAGGKCRRYTRDSEDLSSCEKHSEIFRLARRLPAESVNAIIAGHTHQMIANRVNDIPIIESRSHGRMFGRIDLWIERGAKHVSRAKIFAPRGICKKPKGAGEEKKISGNGCETAEYEGAPVKRVPKVQRIIDKAMAKARVAREESLGVTFVDTFRRSRRQESALCNWFASLTKEVVSGADVGLANAGGIRSNITAGPLRYGDFFEAYPFDNRVATVTLPVSSFKDLVLRSLRSSAGILCFAGVRVEAQCQGSDKIAVSVRDDRGKELKDDKVLKVATHEYLALGTIAEVLGTSAPTASSLQDKNLRQVMADRLRKAKENKRKRTFSSIDFYNPKNPTFKYPGKRPVRCR